MYVAAVGMTCLQDGGLSPPKDLIVPHGELPTGHSGRGAGTTEKNIYKECLKITITTYNTDRRQWTIKADRWHDYVLLRNHIKKKAENRDLLEAASVGRYACLA